MFNRRISREILKSLFCTKGAVQSVLYFKFVVELTFESVYWTDFPGKSQKSVLHEMYYIR